MKLATEEETKEAISTAIAWNTNHPMFEHGRLVYLAIAEYTLNQSGKTMYTNLIEKEKTP